MCPQNGVPTFPAQPLSVPPVPFRQIMASLADNSAVTSVLQCSAVQCSAVQCSAVQCSVVQCSALHCTAQNIPSSSLAAKTKMTSVTVLLFAVLRLYCNTAQHSTSQCSKLHCNALHHSCSSCDFLACHQFCQLTGRTEYSIIH